MEIYISLVKAHPLLTAIIQFAFLGTLGEFVSRWVVKKKFYLPFSAKEILWKMIVWAILAVCIKYAFTGFKGFVNNLADHHLLPIAVKSKGFFRAFCISAMCNLQFGVFMVIFHRILDNLILKEKNWSGLDKGMKSMVWFWIPAHTVTFMLPTDFQIGLAAVWSVVLGVLLGFFNRK
ncbi:MAG: hypothetical protein CSB55_07420 [Candidatus Cloacimonadota bacterium]|nr:MAG: hypothetical protein CSB55_07420 [Candidatus Cloacimonadota bacterium]